MSGAVAVMMGVSSPIVNPLVGGTAFDGVLAPADAFAAWRFNPDGSIDSREGTFTNNVQQWYLPVGGTPGTGYWIRYVKDSGSDTPTGSAMSTWLQLNSAQTWTITEAGIGSGDCNGTISIASDSGGTNIVSTGSFNLIVDTT
jgi:hypothetical protein